MPVVDIGSTDGCREWNRTTIEQDMSLLSDHYSTLRGVIDGA